VIWKLSRYKSWSEFALWGYYLSVIDLTSWSREAG